MPMSLFRTVKFRLIGLGIARIVIGVRVRQLLMLPAVRKRAYFPFLGATLSDRRPT